MQKEKIVTIGGGCGSACVLNGLRELGFYPTAVTGIFDDGGSTGRLRRDYGVVGVGDIRQCLSALSIDKSTRDFLNYRFIDGELTGHSVGNIILSALELNSKDILEWSNSFKTLFKIQGIVLPVTLNAPRLCAVFEDNHIVYGQSEMTNYQKQSCKKVTKLFFEQQPQINPQVINAILNANKIIICPGDLYASLTPHFLIDEFIDAFVKSTAQKILVCNPVNKVDATQNYTVADFIKHFDLLMMNYFSSGQISKVIYNTQKFDLQNQIKFGEIPLCDLAVQKGDLSNYKNIQIIGVDLIGEFYEQQKNDTIIRSPVRFDCIKLAKLF